MKAILFAALDLGAKMQAYQHDLAGGRTSGLRVGK